MSNDNRDNTPRDPIVEAMIDAAVDNITRISEEASNNGAGSIDVKLEAPKLPRQAVFESITTARDPHSGASIKVWRKESHITHYQDVELLEIIGKIPGHASMEFVLDKIFDVDRVCAVELLDSNGLGVKVSL